MPSSGSVEFDLFEEGDNAWVNAALTDTPEKVWCQCDVVAQVGPLVTIKLRSNRKPLQVDLREKMTVLVLANPRIEEDMTSLHHITEAGLLYNMEQRGIKDEPYTFMGNVLVAVNPLKRIPDPSGILGTEKASNFPHPYAVAETSYQQMTFAADNRRTNKALDNGGEIRQTIIAGGESGAGKTESSKMVLKHLVNRTNKNVDSHGNEIDKRLLGSNPITESFGNAATLRNHNSSRFGKFMKLHFQQKSGDEWAIEAASVETYLLERSRVTMHGVGERNFHVFYHLLAGAKGKLRKELLLDQPKSFSYLQGTSLSDSDRKATQSEIRSSDEAEYRELIEAMEATQFDPEARRLIFSVVAGVMHLGNLTFEDEETTEGDIAVEVADSSNPAYKASDVVASLWGVDSEALRQLLVERKMTVRGNTTIIKRNAQAAIYARDAVAKGVYNLLFDHVIRLVNVALNDSQHNLSEAEVRELPFVGVLDIFGFESFTKNGFEQLLINFTNEALQATFNKSVFTAELDLYRKEGLVLDEEMSQPPDNIECMNLLLGSEQPKTVGLLATIDNETRSIKPTDLKMNAAFHKLFAAQKNVFIRPHPKDKQQTFIVNHYAGHVVYTVGEFIDKNMDQLPDAIYDSLSVSSNALVSSLFKDTEVASVKKKARSVITKFSRQIQDLVAVLDDTRTSFIRCVKPNPSMQRSSSNDAWFDRRYVSQQLRCLSIPQTAEVLKSGLPTRIPYSSLLDTYKKALPQKALQVWKTLGGGKPKLFVAALFFAFDVGRNSYKLGHTKVFFKAGMLKKVDEILNWSGKGDSAGTITKRFKYYFIRLLWRRAYIFVVAANRFTRMLQQVQRRTWAATLLQSVFRMLGPYKQFRAHLQQTNKLKREKADISQELEQNPVETADIEVETDADREVREREASLAESAELKQRKLEEVEALRKAVAEERAQEEALRQKTDEQRRMALIKKKHLEEQRRRNIDQAGQYEQEAEQLRRELIAKRILKDVQAEEFKRVREAERAGRPMNSADVEKLRLQLETEIIRRRANYEAVKWQAQNARRQMTQSLDVLCQKLLGMSYEQITAKARDLYSNMKYMLQNWSQEDQVEKRKLMQEQFKKKRAELRAQLNLKMKKLRARTLELAKQQPWYPGYQERVQKIKDMGKQFDAVSVRDEFKTKLKANGQRVVVLSNGAKGKQLDYAGGMLDELVNKNLNGDFSLDEINEVSPDLLDIASAKSPRHVHSHPKDAGMQVTCTQCDTVGNSSLGTQCLNCGADFDLGQNNNSKMQWTPALRVTSKSEITFCVKVTGTIVENDFDTGTLNNKFVIECKYGEFEWMKTHSFKGFYDFHNSLLASKYAQRKFKKYKVNLTKAPSMVKKAPDGGKLTMKQSLHLTVLELNAYFSELFTQCKNCDKWFDDFNILLILPEVDSFFEISSNVGADVTFHKRPKSLMRKLFK